MSILDQSEHSMVWISGPAGVGKTSLGVSYMEKSAPNQIWVQIDAGDTDPASFYYYLRRALAPYESTGRRLPPLLTPEHLRDLAGFARRFFRSFFEATGARTIVAFDNAHEASGDTHLCASLLAALEECPPETRLLVIGRTPPPMEFTRALAGGNLLHIDGDEIRLTLDEAKDMAANRGYDDTQAVSEFWEKTGGWTAGLVLLLDQVRRGITPTRAFSESIEALFSHLATHTLGALTSDARKVLVATCFLTRVRDDWAEQLSGVPNAGKVMETLYRRRWFVDKQQGMEPTYQLHDLFRALILDIAAKQLSNAELAQLRRKTASIAEANADWATAIALSLAGDDASNALRLIRNVAPDLVSQGRWRTLDDWIAQSNAIQISEDPWLIYWQGQGRINSNPRQARAYFEKIFPSFQRSQDEIGVVLTAAAIVQTVYFEGGRYASLDSWIPIVESYVSSQSEYPSLSAELQVYVAMIVAILFRQPEHTLSNKCIERVMVLLHSPISENQRVAAGSALLFLCVFSGRLRIAREVMRAVDPLLQSSDVTLLNLAFWKMYVGFYYSVDFDVEAATSALFTAYTISEDNKFDYVRSMSCSLYAGALYVRDPIEAKRWLDRAEPLLLDGERPYDMAHWLVNLAFNANDRGDFEAAVEYGYRSLSYTRVSGVRFQHIITLGALGLALVESGRLEEAERVLDEASTLITSTHATCYTAWFTLTRALLAFRRGRRQEFIELLTAAFDRAQKDEAEACFTAWNARRTAGPIIEGALELGINTPELRRFVRTLVLEPTTPDVTNWPWRVRVFTLGEFRVEVDGKPVAFGRKLPKKVTGLLKAIIALGRKNVPERRLIDAIWPDDEGDSGYKSFSLALHRLRKVLGDNELVRLQHEQISLDSRQVWTDVGCFEYLIEVSANAGNDKVVSTLERALSLYNGAFMPNDDDQPWVVSCRERLRAKFIGSVRLLGVHFEDRSDFETATRWYLKGLDADELAEGFYQGLIRCFIGRGMTAEALSTYRRLKHLLSITLGMRPSPETEKLVSVVRN
jgi:LuxR family transcriptional regulator, maltose regulon positive regulatory protein